MGAESSPITITGSAVVTPMSLAQGRSTASVSSATITAGAGAYQLTPSSRDRKPIRLPKDMFITPSASPFSAAQAAFTFPAWASWRNASQAARWLSAPPPSGAKRYTGRPGSLNSGVMTSPAFTGAIAKEMRVGGTSRSIKEPDMESLPPMAAAPKSSWADRAPSRAAKGLPQRAGSLRSFSKNS